MHNFRKIIKLLVSQITYILSKATVIKMRIMWND